MIADFRHDWLRAFFVEDISSRKIPADIEDRLFRKLQMIDDATTAQDLRTHPAITSRSCVETLRVSIRFASTGNGDWCSDGMAAEEKQVISIWMTTAIGEAETGGRQPC